MRAPKPPSFFNQPGKPTATLVWAGVHLYPFQAHIGVLRYCEMEALMADLLGAVQPPQAEGPEAWKFLLSSPPQRLWHCPRASNCRWFPARTAERQATACLCEALAKVLAGHLYWACGCETGSWGGGSPFP